METGVRVCDPSRLSRARSRASRAILGTRWPSAPIPPSSPPRWPPTCSSGSCAMCGSTRNRTRDARARRAPRVSSSSAGCSSTSCRRCGHRGRGARRQRVRFRHAAGNRDNGAEPPVIGLIAHMDVSPDAPGAGVEPIVHRAYDGGVIELPRVGHAARSSDDARADREGRPRHRHRERRHAARRRRQGRRGRDHGRGRASGRPSRAARGRRCGSGSPPTRRSARARRCSTSSASARSCAYTIDGSEIGEIQEETFSADEAVITVEGVEVHPGQATGKLVNALRLAARIVAALPARSADAGVDGRPRGLHPPLRD